MPMEGQLEIVILELPLRVLDYVAAAVAQLMAFAGLQGLSG